MDTPPASYDEELSVGSATLLDDVPHGAVLFFVAEQGDRMVFENAEKIIIGRFGAAGDTTFFDVSDYGEVALGISRRHAQIIRKNGLFLIEDLGSTNGTWVNRQRLVPLEPFPLTGEDILSFGPVLKVVVCFHPLAEEEEEVVTQFVLRLTANETAVTTSLHFLSTHVIPYLETVEAIQGLVDRYQDRLTQPITLLNLCSQDAGYALEMTGVAESVHLLQHAAVDVWRTEHADLLATADRVTIRSTLANLAATLLGIAATTAVADDIYPFIEELAALLAVIVTTPLQLLHRVPE